MIRPVGWIVNGILLKTETLKVKKRVSNTMIRSGADEVHNPNDHIDKAIQEH